jgi:hypothetical protein
MLLLRAAGRAAAAELRPLSSSGNYFFNFSFFVCGKGRDRSKSDLA